MDSVYPKREEAAMERYAFALEYDRIDKSRKFAIRTAERQRERCLVRLVLAHPHWTLDQLHVGMRKAHHVGSYGTVWRFFHPSGKRLHMMRDLEKKAKMRADAEAYRKAVAEGRVEISAEGCKEECFSSSEENDTLPLTP